MEFFWKLWDFKLNLFEVLIMTVNFYSIIWEVIVYRQHQSSSAQEKDLIHEPIADLRNVSDPDDYINNFSTAVQGEFILSKDLFSYSYSFFTKCVTQKFIIYNYVRKYEYWIYIIILQILTRCQFPSWLSVNYGGGSNTFALYQLV